MPKVLGSPFGFYLPSERVVVLFSLPPDHWEFPHSEGRMRAALDENGATIIEDGTGLHVCGPTRRAAARFMYAWVLLHELGHHYDFRYRHKRRLAGTRRMLEESADMRMRRLQALEVWSHLEARGAIGAD